MYEMHLDRLKQTMTSEQLLPHPQSQKLTSSDADDSFDGTSVHIWPTWLNIYLQPHVYKPLVILLIIFAFQQLSGAYAIIFYAVNLFLKIGGQFGNGINEYVSMVLLGVIRFGMSIVAVL